MPGLGGHVDLARGDERATVGLGGAAVGEGPLPADRARGGVEARDARERLARRGEALADDDEGGGDRGGGPASRRRGARRRGCWKSSVRCLRHSRSRRRGPRGRSVEREHVARVGGGEEAAPVGDQRRLVGEAAAPRALLEVRVEAVAGLLAVGAAAVVATGPQRAPGVRVHGRGDAERRDDEDAPVRRRARRGDELVVAAPPDRGRRPRGTSPTGTRPCAGSSATCQASKRSLGRGRRPEAGEVERAPVEQGRPVEAHARRGGRASPPRRPRPTGCVRSCRSRRIATTTSPRRRASVRPAVVAEGARRRVRVDALGGRPSRRPRRRRRSARGPRSTRSGCGRRVRAGRAASSSSVLPGSGIANDA